MPLLPLLFATEGAQDVDGAELGSAPCGVWRSAHCNGHCTGGYTGGCSRQTQRMVKMEMKAG